METKEITRLIMELKKSSRKLQLDIAKKYLSTEDALNMIDEANKRVIVICR